MKVTQEQIKEEISKEQEKIKVYEMAIQKAVGKIEAYRNIIIHMNLPDPETHQEKIDNQGEPLRSPLSLKMADVEPVVKPKKKSTAKKKKVK